MQYKATVIESICILNANGNIFFQETLLDINKKNHTPQIDPSKTHLRKKWPLQLNYKKNLWKCLKTVPKNEKNMLCLWVDKINIMTIDLLLKIIYRFSVTLSKTQ